MRISTLSSTQRYAVAALFGLALRQAQIDQARVIACHCERIQSPKEEPKNDGGNEDCSHFWTDKSHGLLRSVFHFLEIDSKAWPGLEKTAASAPAKDQAATFLRMISEEDNESSLKKLDVLTKSVDTMAMRLETTSPSSELTMEKKHESQNRSSDEMIHKISEDTLRLNENSRTTNNMSLLKEGAACSQSNSVCGQKSIEGEVSVNYQRKVTLLFELLSACLADTPEENNESSPLKKGYDARHRTALRLLAIWLDIRWIKMEAMEIMVACSAIAVPEEGVPSDESESENDSWSKWKRGGIIGAAALTGGALMAITGGLAAPAIAAGVSALAPTLGSLVPVIGASGFAAVASAAGSAAGSVAVAASFGAAGAGLSGSKMAKRIGNIEEFEFRNVGQNNQGRLAVAILISGFVMEEEDFIRPWERTNDNLERFALVWESKNLFSLSTAIEDWLKSKLTLELMKQGAMMTVLGGLVTALAWPTALLSAIDFIDSKWTIAIDRSDKAGILLAEVLTKNLQGNRPVTLMGFSLGARIIFKCLQRLAELGDNEGLVEKVVLLGAPISSKGEEWKIARKMVSGRFVNVFSENDWILGVTFRASLLEQGLAGIQKVDIPGIENVNASHLIDGHSSYLWAPQLILKQLDLDSYDPVPLHIPEKLQDGGV